jgi:hypothetical protein
MIHAGRGRRVPSRCGRRVFEYRLCSRVHARTQQLGMQIGVHLNCIGAFGKLEGGRANLRLERRCEVGGSLPLRGRLPPTECIHPKASPRNRCAVG